MTDTRYPYTYACDLIRSVPEYTADGTKLSRGEASRIRQLFARVLGMSDEDLAKKLADYYLAYKEVIVEKNAKEVLAMLTKEGQELGFYE